MWQEVSEDHPKVNCKVRDVDYKIMGNGKHEDEAKEIKYGGETSMSIGERFDEHNDDIQKKKSNTPIYQHFLKEHNGVAQPISLKIIKRVPSDAMLRQATEAVYIWENNLVLKRKVEFGNMNIANM